MQKSQISIFLSGLVRFFPHFGQLAKCARSDVWCAARSICFSMLAGDNCCTLEHLNMHENIKLVLVFDLFLIFSGKFVVFLLDISIFCVWADGNCVLCLSRWFAG